MATKKEPGQFLLDGIGQLDAGVNTGLVPQLLPLNQAAMSTNMTFRGGYGTHRPLIREINLNFNGDIILEELVIHKAFQGACFYQPDTGDQSLMAAIGGHLFQFFPSGTTARVLDVSVPGDPNPASPQQAWLWQSERFVIWNDGVSLPVFFDGSISRRSNGQNKVLATISGSFTTPAVGATVDVAVTAPYTGPLNVPVLVNGKQFVLLSTGSNVPSAMLNKVYDPDTNHTTGEAIVAYSNRVGTLLQDIPVGTKTIQVLTSDLLTVNATGITQGTLLSIGNEIFRLVLQQPSPTPGLSLCTFTLFSLNSFYTTTLSDHPAGSIITISSVAPSPTVGTVGANFVVGTIFNIVVNPTYTGAQQVVWIGRGQYVINPLPVTPSAILTLQNVNGTPGDAMTGDIIALPELPPGRMGTYGLGRNWMALTDGFSFIASDIVGGTSGTEVYNFRDAPLRVTENTYLAGGGAFRVPGALGDIRAMKFAATLDVSLGQGPLQVFTTQAAFSCNAPVDRTTWATITNPILTQSLLGAGALSQNGTLNFNSDILFRAIDGLRSLILARREFDTWGNVPQSREVQSIINQDNATLIQFESLVNFDNRALLTVLPSNGALGVFHQGIVALNADPISTLRGKAPSIYDGFWTGMNVLQLVQGTFNGVERCYAFCYDSVLSRIRMYEILKTDVGAFDNDNTPVTYSFESASIFNNSKNKSQFDQVELLDGEIYLSEIRGVVNIETWYRPNFSDCWTKWISFGVCANNIDTTSPQQYRTRLGLGSPRVQDCDPDTNQPSRIGNTFQFRIQITGSCKFRGALFKAAPVPETRFSTPICKPLCDLITDPTVPCEPCVNIDTCLQFPLVLYNLNANKTYQNDLTTVHVTCPSGSTQDVVVPSGTITYTLPFSPGFTGDYPPLVLNCLSGSAIVRIIPSGATQEQIDVIVDDMISQCVEAYAASIADCGSQQLFSSEQVTVIHACTPPAVLTFSGVLPSWISIDTGTSTVIGAAGAITSTVSVADATAQAQSQLNNWVQTNLDNGSLTCQSPSNVCTDGIGSLASNRYGIDGYFDGIIPNPSGGGTGNPPWDGTFPFYMDGNDPIAGRFGWCTGGLSNPISIQGNFLCNVAIIFAGCIAGVPQWQLWIGDFTLADPGSQIWYGEKAGGNTPEGTYNLVNGSDPAPATVSIVLVDTTATLNGDGRSCAS